MTNRKNLESHPISTLRKEISKTNIKGYSKMKKAAVIDLMLKKENVSKFSHIKMREKAAPKPKEIIIIPKRKIKAERAKKISAPKREAQQAKVIAPKKRVASIPKVVKAKAPPYKKLTSNRDVVQALLDGATSLLAFHHINKGKSQSFSGTGTQGGLTMRERDEIISKFRKSPALQKKLLNFKFRDNLYDEINTLINSDFMRLQQNLGRDTATGKLNTVETSSRPKAVREIKEFLALPMDRKVSKSIRFDEKWGDKTQTGRALYNAMVEIVDKEKPAAKKPAAKKPAAKKPAATISYDYVVERVLAKRGKEIFEKLVALNEEVYLESLKGRSAMEEIVKKAMIKLFKAKKFTKQKPLLDYGLKTRLNELLGDIDEEIPQTANDDGADLFEALKEVKRLKSSNSNPQLVRAALDKVKALRKKLPAGYVELLGKRVVPPPAGGAKKPAAEKPAEPKLNYDQAKKIKQSYSTASYFSWSNVSIPIYLWREKTDNIGDPDSSEREKMNRSSIARYRKVFQSRHGKEMKTEEEWKKTWRDFQDEVRKEITARIKPAMR